MRILSGQKKFPSSPVWSLIPSGSSILVRFPKYNFFWFGPSLIRAHPCEGESREIPFWPTTTNLLTTDVAGPGMLLHFNFQFVIIVWALLVAAGYVMEFTNALLVFLVKF